MTFDPAPYQVTGSNNAAKQVSVTRWNDLLTSLSTAIAAAGAGGAGSIGGFVNIEDFFPSPGTRVPGVTDDTSAFQAAEAYAAANGAIVVLPGGPNTQCHYYLPNGFNAHKAVAWLGVGGASAVLGSAGAGGTIIRVGKNTNGWVWNRSNTDGDGATVGLGDSAGGSMTGVAFFGGNVNVNASGVPTSFRAGDSLTGHGVRIRTTFISLIDVYAVCFGGDGFNINATAGSGGVIEGNANNWLLERCGALYCGGSALLVNGADSNAGTTLNFNAISCAGSGILDASFLGNTHIQAHVRDCGIENPISQPANLNAVPVGSCRYLGQNYSVGWGQEAAASTTVPGTNATVWVPWTKYDNGTAKAWTSGLSWAFARPFANNPTNLANGRGRWINCYAESGQGPIILSRGWEFDGGVWQECGIDSGSTGHVSQGGDRALVSQSFRTFDQTGVAETKYAQLGEPDNPLTTLLASDGTYFWRLGQYAAAAGTFYTVGSTTVWDCPVTSIGRSYPMRLRTPIISGWDGDMAAGRTIATGTAAPTSGEWTQGDRVFNRAPSSSAPVLWECVASGTPGTWQAVQAYTSTEKTKLAAITGTNTGDETKTSIDTKIGVDGSTTTQFYRKDGTWAAPATGSSGYTVVSKSATYTETVTSGELIINASGTFTINLPTAVGNTAKLHIKLTGAGTVTIDPAGSETIDGSATLSISTLNQSVSLASDGAAWLVI